MKGMEDEGEGGQGGEEDGVRFSDNCKTINSTPCRLYNGWGKT